MKTPKIPQPNKSISEISNKTTVENKLSYASLTLGYDFEYGIDLKHRVIKLTGEVDEAMWDVLDSGLNHLEAQSKEKVTIKICSYGGSTYCALAIVGRIKASRAYIVTEGYGQVMSAATLILAAGRVRKMSHYGFFMWHSASYPLDGNHHQNKSVVEQVEKEEKLWARWMAEMSSRTADFWFKNGVTKDAYFTSEELLKLGVVDEIF